MELGVIIKKRVKESSEDKDFEIQINPEEKGTILARCLIQTAFLIFINSKSIKNLLLAILLKVSALL